MASVNGQFDGDLNYAMFMVILIFIYVAKGTNLHLQNTFKRLFLFFNYVGLGFQSNWMQLNFSNFSECHTLWTLTIKN